MTPRKSSRAAVRRQYLAMSGRELVFALAPEAGQGAVRKGEVEGSQERAPTPDPSPRLADARGGGEKTEQAVAQTPSLMARVQSLYEDSAVPVREIARLCGVTERTIYKYAARGGWRGRYAVKPVKGAGGRFVPRGEAGRPVAQGLVQGIKALDPSARAQASTACAAASARAAKARARADARQVWEARVAAINAVSAAMAAYNRFRAGRAAVRTPMEITADERMAAHYVDQIEAALACVRTLKM